MIHCETRSQVISALYLFPVNTITVAVLGFHRRERAPIGGMSETTQIKVLHWDSNLYGPQTKFAKVMFLHVSVCPRGGGWYPSMPCRSPGGGAYPSMPCRFPGPHSRGSLRGLAEGGSPGPHKGEGGLQAHTQGGSPGPYLGGVSQHALRQTPPATATAAGGMHPTALHVDRLQFLPASSNNARLLHCSFLKNFQGFFISFTVCVVSGL